MFCNFRFELRLGIYWFFLNQIALKSDFFSKKLVSPPFMEMSDPPLKMYIIIFSYLMVAGAIDCNICPEVLGMTKGPNGKCSSLLHLKPLNNRFITYYLTKKVFFFMAAKHYQVLIIYIYTAYIPLAFNKYNILTLFHTINDQGERPDRHHLWTETCQLHYYYYYYYYKAFL